MQQVLLIALLVAIAGALIYAGILGYLLFAEVPDRFTLIGAAIIVGSALFIFHRERRLQAGS